MFSSLLSNQQTAKGAWLVIKKRLLKSRSEMQQFIAAERNRVKVIGSSMCVLLCLNCLHSLRERGRLLLVLLKRMFGMAAGLVWSWTLMVSRRKSKLQLLCSVLCVRKEASLLKNENSVIIYSLLLSSKPVWLSYAKHKTVLCKIFHLFSPYNKKHNLR